MRLTVTSLNRFAVKGLSGDALESVHLRSAGETFPDDRRFALLFNNNADKIRWKEGEWRHKENFLCAFTAPELLTAQLATSYQIVSSDPDLSRGYPCDDPTLVACMDSATNNRSDHPDHASTPVPRRLLTIRERSSGRNLLLDDEKYKIPHLDLELEEDRLKLAAFMSSYSSRDVVCITAGAASAKSEKSASSSDEMQLPQLHTHQFGNTASGYKQRGDTRTIHIINQQTVNALSHKIGIPLSANRFRPNIVIDGPPAWSEFDWIGKQLAVQDQKDKKSGLLLTILSKTVRCKGVSVDPLEPTVVLDIPSLLIEHFPEHGPYLGVYAVVDAPGSLALGDSLTLLN